MTSEAPLLQTQSSERSFTVSRTEVENLPLWNFTNLTTVLPGISGTTSPVRTGDQGASSQNSNIMMDGVSIVDTGGNGVILSVNTESIAEIKVRDSFHPLAFRLSRGTSYLAGRGTSHLAAT